MPGNDHRLGANEAPPAIISIFLGEQLTDIFEQIKAGGATSSKGKGTMTVGVDILPPLPKDAGDRNRTSPFAFTGNRFEFRAVGSSQSIAGPLVAMNTIVAESIDYVATELEKATGGNPAKLAGAVQTLLKDIIEKHGAIVYNGDGYTEAWHQEAEKRGLPNMKTTVDALPVLGTPGGDRLVREVQGAQQARDVEPHGHLFRAVLQDGQRREQVGRGNVEDDDLPGGDSLSKRVGDDLR